MNNAFLSGKVPMVQMGTWYQQYATVDSLTAALDGAGVPKDTPKITIVPIPFPDVAGKGNPSTMFADPDAGHAVNAKSKNRNAAITFALWMGGTKEGQQIVVNNMDSFATLNGVTPAVRQDQAGQPQGAEAQARRGHRKPRRREGRQKLRHLRPAEPGDHRRQPGDGERRQARRRTPPPTSKPWPTPKVRHSTAAGQRQKPEDDHDHNDDADGQRRRPHDGRLAGPSGLHRPPGLPWILPAMIVSVGLLYYCIFYTGYISTLDWDGAARCGRASGWPTTPGWCAIRCSGGPSPTPWCSSW